ncbi:MAG TPA: bifunctional (p)ppGpp synthetase/guanosine-3',5'-bis(diphosphate) 3'-pyrophosphohydrolase [Bacillota bacterium]|nr:bifunctional (p)ppGpp synthetase/guanosine-3',5'-bis(diphosphate) 3'-pyrophosphohydrolase [Bacillota bacterium]HOL09470.1 bifunctional (p)ppGpp synthetase/guanosine-3',5'-bis(diphosphate) 3'-pyrophosphohydrolase [Bacillota bacterium]HPO97692.1 bifunctional (p)ppGpp synthetase/guanosine-3',5'-bis(diphosphate) 3'-pyrophosphohydrolase [Bacillota bacterium]
MTFEEFLSKIESSKSPEEVERIKNAYQFAAKAHEGQKRDSGEDYIQHPLEVGNILFDLGMDTTSIVASLLHDVVEDTETTIEDISKLFGPEVAMLVDGVTKLTRLNFQTKQEQQMENLRKMFLAMTQDLRVIIIKLADRLHNMRTLKHLPEEKQRKIAKETLEIYSPLTHRLGVWKIKWELEDLALRYLDPEAYYDLVNKVAKKRQEREVIINEVQEVLRQALKDNQLKAEIQGRPKHFYSIYHKMQEQGKAFADIYDLLGLRVIVDSVQDCYEVLGIVHTLWKPIPGRFKDYVAMPKSNMYQSLHTTVIGPHGEPFEIQIRTWEMHRTAEYGIAAHWLYKENGTSDHELREKIAWLRHLIEWQGEMKDTEEFMETLRIGLFTDEVFVFTPRGDVKNLPAGSTPIDFAYSIHTTLGHQCAGAKVNSRLVPLDYQLKNGDIIQIMTSKQTGPSRDWLQFVKTSKAKNRIRQWLREQNKEENIQIGRELLERELRKHGMEVHENLRQDILIEAAKKLGFGSIDDLLASVGDLKITPAMVFGKLAPEKELAKVLKPEGEEQRKNKRTSYGVKVKGVEDLLVKFSRCCNPVPGDEIVGFITRGKGVSVHRSDCTNLANESPDRIIEVEWESEIQGTYPVDIEIVGNDRVNLLTDVMNAISELKLYLSAAKARSKKGGTAYINLTLEISNSAQINLIFNRIKKVDGIQQVYRVSRLVR